MKTFIVQTTCYGFRKSLWKQGETVMVDDSELSQVPRHFVSPESYEPPEDGATARSLNKPGPGMSFGRASSIVAPPMARDILSRQESSQPVPGPHLPAYPEQDASEPPSVREAGRILGVPKARKPRTTRSKRAGK